MISGVGPTSPNHCHGHIDQRIRATIIGLLGLLCGGEGQLFPARFDLTRLSGGGGVVLNGDQIGDQSGIAVCGAGDVNADGVADLLIGAFLADPARKTNAGRAYVVFGRSGLDGVVQLSSLDGTDGFVVNGGQEDDRIGYAVSTAGDVNADGISDFLIGAYNADVTAGREEAGKTYVVFGKSGLGSTGSLDLSRLDGTDGFVLNGEEAGDRSGFSVSGAGDVNGDGVADLIIGAYWADPAPNRDKAGKSYVVFGKSQLGASVSPELSRLNGADGFVINGDQKDDHSGIFVAGAGDVNGDGVDDLLIGAYLATPAPGREEAGKVHVVFGKSGLGASGSLELSNLDGTIGFVLNGEHHGDQCGRSVSGAGDVNADGVADFLIGAPEAGPFIDRPDAGRTYVIFGGRSVGAGDTVELSSLDGTHGFVIDGEGGGDQSGFSVSGAGDVNRDGVADLLIGAQLADLATGVENVGKTYVVFGKSGIGASGTLELSTLDGATGFVLSGAAKGDQSGSSVSSADDVNADGIADILIGAKLAKDGGALTGAGKTYVVYGRKSSSPVSAIAPPMITPPLDMAPIFPPLGSPDATHNPTSPPSNSPLLPLAIGGGVCAVLSSVTAALVVIKCRRRRATARKEREQGGSSIELTPSPNTYDRMPAGPVGYGDTTLSPNREKESSDAYDQMPVAPVAYGDTSIYPGPR